MRYKAIITQTNDNNLEIYQIDTKIVLLYGLIEVKSMSIKIMSLIMGYLEFINF